MSIVTASTENAVCTLAMNRPSKLNALNREMYGQLTVGFKNATNDDHCRVVVLKGAQGIFTAGNDIGDFAAAIAEDGGRFNAPFLLMQAMLNCTKPIIASVDGAAIGIGATMLLHCDLIYASHGASFHTPFTDLGVCPEFGSSVTFPLLLGSQRAAQMLLLGDPLNSTDAERFGLVNQLVDTNALDITVAEVAKRLAAKPADALRTSKRLLDTGKQQILSAIESEGEEFARLMNTEEFKNNLQMFLNKSA